MPHNNLIKHHYTLVSLGGRDRQSKHICRMSEGEKVKRIENFYHTFCHTAIATTQHIHPHGEKRKKLSQNEKKDQKMQKDEGRKKCA